MSNAMERIPYQMQYINRFCTWKRSEESMARIFKLPNFVTTELNIIARPNYYPAAGLFFSPFFIAVIPLISLN